MSKVKFGLKNVHIAPMSSNGNYEEVFAIPGAVNLSLDAEGDSSDFYADNRKFYSSFANNGYSGSLEIAKLVEDFLTKVMGQTKDENGGILETINDIDKYFAMMFEVDGDEKNTRYIYYKCKASRSSTEAETTSGTKDPKTDTVDITATADDDGNVKYYVEEDETNKEFYDKFFETVAGKKTAII